VLKSGNKSANADTKTAIYTAVVKTFFCLFYFSTKTRFCVIYSGIFFASFICNVFIPKSTFLQLWLMSTATDQKPQKS